jgi:hypothetical protein
MSAPGTAPVQALPGAAMQCEFLGPFARLTAPDIP